jgi:hypothetical protein
VLGRADAIFAQIVSQGIPAEIVETHDAELKLRVQDNVTKLWQIFSVIEGLRAGRAALSTS